MCVYVHVCVLVITEDDARNKYRMDLGYRSTSLSMCFVHLECFDRIINFNVVAVVGLKPSCFGSGIGLCDSRERYIQLVALKLNELRLWRKSEVMLSFQEEK